ncbi:MAG: helix-turn-helix domain-containing protein [Candidatus Dormibacteraceae bacterium]
MADLIPLQDAARELGVNPATLYRYLKAGKLRSYDIAFDRRTFLDREELERLRKPRRIKRG